jgi:hypothetical protein
MFCTHTWRLTIGQVLCSECTWSPLAQYQIVWVKQGDLYRCAVWVEGQACEVSLGVTHCRNGKLQWQTAECLLRAVCPLSPLSLSWQFKTISSYVKCILKVCMFVCLFSCLRVCFSHPYTLCTVHLALLLPRKLSLRQREGIIFHL